jgi:hypothetical protein
MNLDWPNLIAGSLVGALAAPVPAAFIRIAYAIFGRGASASIMGTWYSAEYDIKSGDPKNRNTILQVRVRRRLDGKVTIVPTAPIVYANPKRPTNWKVVGEVKNEVLVGKWKSTTAHSTRHGTVLLRFYDDGRAIGYYLGHTDMPVYGYWLLSRDENDLSGLSAGILRDFQWVDLKKLVDECDPRSNMP